MTATVTTGWAAFVWPAWTRKPGPSRLYVSAVGSAEATPPRQLAGQFGVYEREGYDRIGDVLFAIRSRCMNCPFVYRTAVKYRDGTKRFIESPEMFEPAVLTRHFTGVHTALPHDPDMHCLMILHGPGVAPGQRDIPTNIIDIAPTVAALIDVPAPADCEGNVVGSAIARPDGWPS